MSRTIKSYEGQVVESHDGTMVVLYDIDDDIVEEAYGESQIVGELPPKGTLLKVSIEII